MLEVFLQEQQGYTKNLSAHLDQEVVYMLKGRI